jgi:hypothetical protein
MMEILVFAGIPILLVLLLSMLGATWNLEAGDVREPEEDRPGPFLSGADSSDCVGRIFSPEDQKFVERQGSPRLRQIYRAERTRVALYWAHSVLREVAQVMREHRLEAAYQENLDVRRELQLLLRYVEFRALCGLLIFSVRVFGPHTLGNLATHVLQVSRRIGVALETATAAGRIQPAGTLGGA